MYIKRERFLSTDPGIRVHIFFVLFTNCNGLQKISVLSNCEIKFKKDIF